jgi:tripartite-type tricarboxylate transporter receptor subunit TctC
MKLPRRKILHLAAGAAAFAAVSRKAWAESYPTRAVRVVVPFAPGGPTDIFARLIVQKLSEQLGKQFYIENVGGASGSIGTVQVAKALPDGYTILLHTSAMASNGALYRTLPFNPIDDFVPITMVVATQFVVGGSPKNPAMTLRDLIAQAKANPGKLNYGSSGPGSSLHLQAEMFKHAAGVDLVHIPYRGDAPIMTALMANDIQLAFVPQSTGSANVQGNQIRGLAVTGTKRLPSLLAVPTLLEQGVAGLEAGSWIGMFAPARTAPDIVLTIQRRTAEVLADPAVRERLLATGMEPVGSPPAEFETFYKADIARYLNVVEAAKIPKLD